MNAVNYHLRLFPKNWKLGLMVMTITTLFLLPPVLVADHWQGNTWWFIMAALPLVGISLGYFITETQKEMMSRGTGFLLPNFQHSVLSTQMSMMLVIGIITFLLALFLPALAPVTTGNLLNSLTLGFVVMASFAITSLVDFLFKYSAWLTAKVMLPYFFFIQLGKKADPQTYSHWLGHHGLVLIGSALIIGLTIRILMALNLPRRLAEQPYISTMDLYQPAKIQVFKNSHAVHAQIKSQGDRPLKNTMDLCLEKASRERYAGRESWAIFWETLHLSLATTVPRTGAGLWGIAIFIVLFILTIGYADSLHVSKCNEEMYGWYSSFPFMFTIFPFIAFHHLATRPFGLLRDRLATEKTGYYFAGWAVIIVAALSLLTLGLLHLMGAIMPEYETPRMLWAYYPPTRPHIPFLPLLIMPVSLLISLLWSRISFQNLVGGVSMQVFLLFNALLCMEGYGWPLMVVLGLSTASWIALPYAWRRRIRREK